MKSNVFWYAGLSAVCVYLLAVVLGGILYPGYSHISQDVSQLTSTQSPIRGLMNPIFLIYNLLLVVFGVGIYGFEKNRLSKLGAVSMIFVGILGAVLWVFPINTRGTEMTFVGAGHIVLVSIISLLTVASDFLFWRAFANSHRQLAWISLVAGVLFLLTGPFAAFTVMSPYAGFFERLPIGVFLLWIVGFCVSMIAVKNSRE